VPPKEEDLAQRKVGILLLEDNEDDAFFIQSELKKGGIDHFAKCVSQRDEFISALAEFKPDLILSDYKLPEFAEMEPLRLVRERSPDLPFILVTGALGEELSVEVMKEGATDYILKDRLFRLVPAVERALREAEERRRRREADELLKKQHDQLQRQNIALQESDERFRQLAENIREVFWMTDTRKDEIIYVSPGYEEIWGRTCQSLYESARDWMEGIHREDRERVAKALEKQVLGEYDEVYRIVRQDGSIRWIHDRAFPVRNEAGEVYRLTGIAEDITERKMAERRLEARNEVIKALAVSGTLREASEKILESIGKCLDWDFGAFWEVQGEPKALRCLTMWRSLEGQAQEFVEAIQNTRCGIGEEFPGHIWKLGRAVWRPNADEETSFVFPRAVIAARCGFHGAFGFPVLVREEVVGVIEFFSRQIKEPDTALLEMASALGNQIGQFIRRKHAEEALREAEENYRSIYENAIEGIFQTTPEGGYLSANPALARMLGYASPEELLSSISDLGKQMCVRPESRLELKRRLETEGQVRGFENQIYRKDGRAIWISVNAHIVRGVDEKVLYYEGTSQDITERKRAEVALRESEARKGAVMETALDAIVTIDREGKLIEFNSAAEKMFGCSRGGALGQEMAEKIFPKRLREWFRTGLNSNFEAEIGPVLGSRTEIRAVRGDGAEFPVEFTITRVALEKAPIFTVFIRDLTSRKRAELQLATLAHAVESTAEMICITDMEDRFTFANPAFLEAYGYTEEEIIGETPAILFSPRNPPELLGEILRDTRAGGWNGEVIDLRKDGSDFPIFLGTSQIRNSEGEVIGLIGVARDITERKRAEKRSTALSTLSFRLSAATTPKEAAEIIMDTASNLMGWDAGFVDLYSPGGDKTNLVLLMDTIDGNRVAVEPPNSIVDPTQLMQLVTREGAKLVNSPDELTLNTELVPFGDTARRSASKMYVPIRSGGQTLGVLSIQSYRRLAYSEEDLKLLQTLAERCGDALQRIEMTEALREAEANYRGIFENATEGIFQSTPDGRLLSANPALARMFGHETAADLILNGSDIGGQAYVRPERRAELKRLLERDGMVKGFEAECYRKDRTKFWISVNGHVVRDAGGRILYHEGTAQDVTERKRAEIVLMESEERFRTLFESAPIGMALHDARGKYVQTNQAYQRMIGYTDGELRQLSVRKITHPDDVLEGQRFFEEFREGKREQYQREKRYLHKDGHLVWAQASASALRNSKGELIYIISMVEDITERKQLEQEVIETSANERRRVGHELHDGLGQYLAGIAFKAKALEQSLVAESLPHGVEAKELAALVSNAISQTRSLARGLDPIEVETIGLQAALQNLAVETQKFFNISCRFQCAENMVEVDPQVSLALYRVVQEAIHNGITHGEATAIDIDLSMNGSNLCLRVQDDGTGFQPEERRKTGIGLRVMQYRARSIGGSLRVSSEAKRGTEVRCVVPRRAGRGGLVSQNEVGGGENGEEEGISATSRNIS
jgi:PAS domain S-box-containing protein